MNLVHLGEKYKELRAQIERLKSAITFKDELEKKIENLERRAKSPEVRVLVVGPLKSGKSTFMRVLTKNPRVSQVSPLPTYPCIVEIRCFDDANTSNQAGCEIFYPGNRREEMSLEEGEKELERLLKCYIGGDADDSARPHRVVQKVPSPAIKGADVVLVDSPGLLFGDPKYAEATHSLIPMADILVFVIRPEQLFFESVKSYLDDLAQRAKHLPVFILVNLCQKGWNINNGRIVECDQSEFLEELIKYFRRHVATSTVLEALEKNTRNFRIVYADLIAVGRQRLSGEVEVSKTGWHETTAARADGVAEIEGVITDRNLAECKFRGVAKQFKELLIEAERQVERSIVEAERGLREIEARKATYENALKLCTKQKEDLQRTIQSRQDDARSWENRIQLVEESVDLRSRVEMGAHDPLRDFLCNTFCGPDFAEIIDEDMSDGVKSHVTEIYTRWRNGDFGSRTLKNLWKRVLEAKSEALRASVKEMRANIIKQIDDVIRRALKHALIGLEQINLCIALPPTYPDSEEAYSGNLPLLDIPQDLMSLIHLKFWRKYEAADLWGENGDRIIDRSIDKLRLKRYQNHFINCIIGAPWNVVEIIDKRKIRKQILAYYEKELCLRIRDECKRNEACAKTMLEEKRRELVAMQNNYEQLEREVQKTGEECAKRDSELVKLREADQIIKELKNTLKLSLPED